MSSRALFINAVYFDWRSWTRALRRLFRAVISSTVFFIPTLNCSAVSS